MAEVTWVAEAPTTAHPLHGVNAADRYVSHRVNVRLFEPDGTSAAIARHAVDGTAFTVTVADRAWSDGVASSATDVCATIARLSDRARPTASTGLVLDTVSSCEIDAADPKTARLVLTREIADPRPWLVVPLLPAHRPDQVAFTPGPGTEPTFVFLSDTQVRRDKKGWVFAGADTSRITASPDPAKAFADSGRAALVEARDLAGLRSLDDAVVRKWGDPRVVALVLDTSRPPFADHAARVALDRALDRDATGAALFGRDEGLGRQPWSVATGPFPAGSPLALRDVWTPPVDPAAAEGLATFAVAVPIRAPDDVVRTIPKAEGAATDPRAWTRALAEGARPTEAQAALVVLDGPVCAWFRTGGPRNVFGFSDPDVDTACRAVDRGDPEASRTLHGLLLDRRPALFLVTDTARVVSRAGG